MNFFELEELKKDLAELKDRIGRLEKEALIIEELLKKIILFYAFSFNA
ncbi:MAG: hypothetical protein QW224_05930 [Desulfurococcaceae archaeon]